MTVRSLPINKANHPLPKPASLRAEDSHGRWYKSSRLVTLFRIDQGDYAVLLFNAPPLQIYCVDQRNQEIYGVDQSYQEGSRMLSPNCHRALRQIACQEIAFSNF